MNAPRPAARPRRAARSGGRVVALVALRIERALAGRRRYRYVQPRVVAEGAGWKIVSPNCSRNVDPAGGEIDIARFVPRADGRWTLCARDHDAGAWVAGVDADALTLEAAIERVCADPAREYWP